MNAHPADPGIRLGLIPMDYDDTVLELRREFHEGTDWHIWRARSYKDRPDGGPTGCFMATRLSPDAGIDPTVMEPTPERLRATLRQQADLVARGVMPYAISELA